MEGFLKEIFYFAISLIIPAILVFVGIKWLNRHFKSTSDGGKSLYLFVPQVFLIVSFFILQGYFTKDFSPDSIQNDERIETVQDAEKRIRELESYTRFLEIRLDYAKDSIYLLVGMAFFFYSIPLAIIAFNWAKTYQDKENIDSDK